MGKVKGGEMRKFVIVTMLIALVACVGCVKNAEANTTGRGVYTTPYAGLTTFLNENDCFYHSHEYTDEKGIDNPYGIGLDIKVFDFKKLNKEKDNKILGFLDSINIENKYDFNNENYSVFAVLSIDLTSLFQGK